jgi:predicted nucleotidyltransferase component of viral defense system
LGILEKETGILAELIEKNYWLMHVLGGKKQNFNFAIKGGTSLSKGYGIIHRLSEDIDIQITPNSDLGIVTDPKIITISDYVNPSNKWIKGIPENLMYSL